MLIPVTTHATIPVAAASCHALSDFALPLPRLVIAYGSAFVLTQEDTLVTPLFAICSMLHFAKDVGSVQKSAILHAVWVGVAVVFGIEAGFDLFSAFYCLVHAPNHVLKLQPALKMLLFAMALIVILNADAVMSAIVGLGRLEDDGSVCGGFLLTDNEQRVIIGHVLAEGNSPVHGDKT